MEEPVVPDTVEAPAVTPAAAEPSSLDANYHILLWPEPPGPPTYLCLVPLCGYKDATLADIQAHIPSVHSLTAIPTPLAADQTLVP
jgi:hypothetical protein